MFGLIASARRDEVDEDLEILVLRHQMRVLERQMPGLVAYRPSDLALLAAQGRLLPKERRAPSWSPQRRCCAGSRS